MEIEKIFNLRGVFFVELVNKFSENQIIGSFKCLNMNKTRVIYEVAFQVGKIIIEQDRVSNSGSLDKF